MRIVLAKCSDCKRIRVNGNWVREPEFLSRDIKHTHTYCPSCLADRMQEAENLAVESIQAEPIRALHPVSAA